MFQHYFRKSALLLSLVTAGLLANQVKADEPVAQDYSQDPAQNQAVLSQDTEQQVTSTEPATSDQQLPTSNPAPSSKQETCNQGPSP